MQKRKRRKCFWLLIATLILSNPIFANLKLFNDTGYLLVAHMGDWQNSSPNSLTAYQSAIEKGFYGIESDLQYDAVEDKLYMSHGEKSSPSSCPSLQQFIDICTTSNTKAIIDIKWNVSIKGLERALEQFATSSVIWQTGDEEKIQAIRKYNSKAEIWFLAGSIELKDRAIKISKKYNCRVINSDKNILDSEWLNKIHSAGINTCAYNLDTDIDRKYWSENGVDIIMTNKGVT